MNRELLGGSQESRAAEHTGIDEALGGLIFQIDQGLSDLTLPDVTLPGL